MARLKKPIPLPSHLSHLDSTRVPSFTAVRPLGWAPLDALGRTWHAGYQPEGVFNPPLFHLAHERPRHGDIFTIRAVDRREDLMKLWGMLRAGATEEELLSKEFD